MSHKVNDRVRVLKNIEVHKYYGTQIVSMEMAMLENKVVTIVDAIRDDENRFVYKIIEDGGTWFWTDEMFETLADSKVRKCVQVNLSNVQINKLCEYYGEDSNHVSDSDIVLLHDKFMKEKLK